MDVLSAYHGIASGSPCVVPSRESISPPPQINSLDYYYYFALFIIIIIIIIGEIPF